MNRKPDWIRVKLSVNENFGKVSGLLDGKKLHTVCRSAKCPNICECWSAGTATFMILGDVCTRNCGFCGVSRGKPQIPDIAEAKKIAESVKELGLKYVVITSVTRDDLADGGAGLFADTITEIRKANLNCGVEVVVRDFGVNKDSINNVLSAKPSVFAQNIETIKRLYPVARSKAN